MNVEELVGEFRKLTPEDRAIFMVRAKRVQDNAGASLRPGAPVRFKTRHGYEVEGVFVRMKQKYAEVHSNFDAWGRRGTNVLTWTVPPAGLIPITKKPDPAPVS